MHIVSPALVELYHTYGKYAIYGRFLPQRCGQWHDGRWIFVSLKCALSGFDEARSMENTVYRHLGAHHPTLGCCLFLNTVPACSDVNGQTTFVRRRIQPHP